MTVAVPPEQVIAYAAGVRSAGGPGAEWSALAQLLQRIGLGTWDPKVLEDAVLDWIYAHVEVEGLFARALRGSA